MHYTKNKVEIYKIVWLNGKQLIYNTELKYVWYSVWSGQGQICEAILKFTAN